MSLSHYVKIGQILFKSFKCSLNVLNKGKTVLPQLAERLLLKPDDPGSNPVFGTWIGHFFAFKEKTKVFNVYLSLPFLKK